MSELRDPVCSVSHLITAVWAAYATLILIRITPAKTAQRISVVVFGLSMVLLYLASGTFHGVPYTQTANPAEFRFFQLLDQSAIFLVIAGTNTPCLVILLGGERGKWYLKTMWLLAAAGIACLWVLPKPPHELIVAICLGMGWFGVVPGARYYRVVGWRAMNWVLLGAGAYTTGAVLELLEWPMLSTFPVRFGYHEIFHLCDTVGSLAFFLFITRHVIPYEKPEEESSADRAEKPELAAVGRRAAEFDEYTPG
ncbi:MAG: hemolysin-III related [Gemmataceae bacterium]|nr:hemolysin-III related [Gemmataceae bacterium]